MGPNNSSRKRQGVTSTIRKVVDNQSRRGPRQRISGNLGASTIIRGTELVTPLTITNTNTGVAGYLPLIAGVATSRAVYTFINVAKNYQKFLYLPGTHYRYVPNVGLNTSGTTYVAYIDNPEALKDYAAADAATRLTILKGQANMRSYPVWQEFTMPLTATPRQRSFATDVTTDYTDANTLNRVCQGAFLYGIEIPAAATADTVFARPSLQVNMRLEELSASPVT